MGKFDGILICTDLDGTLLRKDKSISKENLEAIEHFKREGGYFTFITGRMPYFSDEMYHAIKPNAPIGCINGAGLYDYEKGDYLWMQSLPRDVNELIEYVEGLVDGIGIQYNAADKVYFCSENESTERFRSKTGVPKLSGDYKTIGVPAAKIVFCDMNNENVVRVAELLESHPRADEFDFIRSERTFFEILPKGASKGGVLTRLAAALDVDMSKTVAIGDYNNDISMIRAAGLGVAVANATEEAKAAADHITVSNEEHAIAKIISDIESGKLRFN